MTNPSITVAIIAGVASVGSIYLKQHN